MNALKITVFLTVGTIAGVIGFALDACTLFISNRGCRMFLAVTREFSVLLPEGEVV